MKKALLAVAAWALLAACSDDKPKWQSDAPVYITGVESGVKQSRETDDWFDALLTVQEVVEKAFLIEGWNFDEDKLAEYPGHFLEIAFNEDQRDLVNGRLMMYPFQVINPWKNGALSGTFLDITDVTLQELQGTPHDEVQRLRIIAYIPDAVIKKAAIDIRAAYAAENYDEVYRLFNEAYTFIPISHNDWQELKNKGLN